MIGAQLYKYVYLLLVSFLTFLLYNKYRVKTNNSNYENTLGNIALVIFLIFFIGLRPISGVYFQDMANYVEYYHAFYDGVPFRFDWNAENILFDNYLALVGSLSLGTEFFFTTIAAIYFGCAYIGIRRLFPNDTIVAYLVFLAAFSTFSYGTNGVKSGAAASLFILALAYRQNLIACVSFVLISWGFHHSMQLPVAAFILTLFFKDTKWYFSGWVFSLLMAVAHVGYFQSLFAGMSDEGGASYLTADESSATSYLTGFRPDFILYSSMPVLVGYYAVYKKEMQLSQLYTCLLNMYLCTNGIWMLCMYASFTNRIAYLSWFLYPIVLIYPFLNENWGPSRYKTFAKVMVAHLTFTLFMTFVYYA